MARKTTINRNENNQSTRATSPAAKTKHAFRGSGAERPSPTQQQIEERAREIWRASGCVPGRDEENWHEAETQLKKELSKHS